MYPLVKTMKHRLTQRLALSMLILSPVVAQTTPLTSEQLQQLLPTESMVLVMPELKQAAVTTSKPSVQRPVRHRIARTKTIAKPLESLTTWQQIGDTSIMRLTLDAPEAMHMNLGFDQVSLPKEARLYILDSQEKSVLGKFDYKHINNAQLWSNQLLTNKVTIELQVPHQYKDQVRISLRQAGLGDKPFSTDSWLKSGSCNIDVNCSEGDNWRDVSRSVARYLISDSSGTFTCTGSLMNNDRFDQRPIFMTAAHCGVSESTVASMNFFWNYETSVCEGTPDGDLSQNQTGAKFISRGEGTGARSDFALVELNESPLQQYNVFFSGWNAVPQEAENVVAIHHPSGDEKRISIEADPLTLTEYGSDDINSSAQYYRIDAWDAGTTEGGSSGSGIWNQQKQLIGTLSGGLASCTAPAESDWYGRMSSHWQSAGNHPLLGSSTALAPSNGELVLAGLDSCDGAAITLAVSDSAPARNAEVNLSSSLSGGTGPFEFAWDFDNDGIIDSTEAAPTHSYTQSGEYQPYLMVSDANQCRTSQRTRLVVSDPEETYLADGVKPSMFSTPSNSEGTWVITSDTAAEGHFSLRSQIINANETSIIAMTDTFNNGSITFSYKVSSEAGFDKFTFAIDGVEQLTVDGEVDWTEATFNLSAGSRTLRWQYTKDASVSQGIDTAWIDNLVITQDSTSPVTPPPANSDNSGGGSVPWTLGLMLLGTGWLRRKLSYNA